MPELLQENGFGHAVRSVNPRRVAIDQAIERFHLRHPDGRWLNLDGTGLTDGVHRWIGHQAQLAAMQRRSPVAAECQPKRI